VLREKGGDTDIDGDSVLKLPVRSADGSPVVRVFSAETNEFSAIANGILHEGRVTKVRYPRRRVHLLVSKDTQGVAA
jgi:hypothetical protein